MNVSSAAWTRPGGLQHAKRMAEYNVSDLKREWTNERMTPFPETSRRKPRRAIYKPRGAVLHVSEEIAKRHLAIGRAAISIQAYTMQINEAQDVA